MTTERPGELDRRTVLKLLGGTAALGAAPSVPRLRRLSGSPATRALLSGALRPALPAAPVPTRQVFVFRRDDLLDLRFDLYNLVLDNSTPRKLVRLVPTAPAFVVAVFPFQQVAEEAVQSPPAPPWPDPPLHAVAPGPSQLAFGVPKSVTSLPFTLDGLLEWTGLVPQLEAVARYVKDATPAAPGVLETFIEAPWNLYLSPDQFGRWHHSPAPVKHGIWTELWQTRLGVGKIEPPASVPQIRAVWTPNWPQVGPANPFVMPLAPDDRRDIVTLTCGLNFPGVPTVPGKSIPVKLFMLTPLGASLDLEGSWDQLSVSSLTDWRHRMTTGRDSYVRIVRSGYLFPFALRRRVDHDLRPRVPGVPVRRRRRLPGPAPVRRDHPADPHLRGPLARAVRGPAQPAPHDHRQDARLAAARPADLHPGHDADRPGVLGALQRRRRPVLVRRRRLGGPHVRLQRRRDLGRRARRRQHRRPRTRWRASTRAPPTSRGANPP